MVGQLWEDAAPWAARCQVLQSGGGMAGVSFGRMPVASMAVVPSAAAARGSVHRPCPPQQLHGLLPSPAHLGWG